MTLTKRSCCVIFNGRKATGADGLSARLLKLAAPGIAKSLTQLFNYSLKSGQIPREWKAAHVTPVPKKGDKNLTKNYRPVSVLPTVVKVFEAMVHHQLFTYLEANSLLHPAQSGFRPLHSTQHALLKAMDDFALDNDEIVGAVMIDLSKAFDSIDHNLLIAKLDVYGVRDKERVNYLTD